MQINVIDIPREGFQLDFQEDGEPFNKILERHILIISPVNYHLFLKKDRERVSIRGYIDTRLALSCSFCLTRFNKDVHWNIAYTLSPEEGYVTERQKRLSSKDMEISFFDGKVIDTKDIFMEQLFLEMPIRFLCKEDCKGLCAKCGFNLNNGNCGCVKEQFVDLRLAKLKELKLDKGGI